MLFTKNLVIKNVLDNFNKNRKMLAPITHEQYLKSLFLIIM